MKRLLHLLTTLICLTLALTAFAARVPPGTEDEIRERLQPHGKLCVAGGDCEGDVVATAADSGGGAKSGEEVYNTFCFACHTAGVSGAPKLGSAEDWAPRLDKGMDVLWETTLNGLGAMPPKGTCMSCSDDELRAAVDYMIDG